MKSYNIAIDTFIEGDYRKAGQVINLGLDRAKELLAAGQIIDPDAMASLKASVREPAGKKTGG